MRGEGGSYVESVLVIETDIASQETVELEAAIRGGG